MPFETEGHSDAPSLVVDSDGTLHLAWGERPGGMFENGHVAYARLASDQGEWTEPAALPNPEGFASGTFPALTIAGDRTPVLVWELHRRGRDRATALAYSVSADGGENFAPALIVSGSADDSAVNGSLQGGLGDKLDANARGDVAAVNSVFTRDESSRIVLYRIHGKK